MMIRQGRRDLTPEMLDKLISCFQQFKAENDDYLDSDNVFVETDAFRQLIAKQHTRSNTVLLGRKGDGKTALLRRLAHALKREGMRSEGQRVAEALQQIDVEDTYFPELIHQFSKLASAIHDQYPNIPNEQIAKKLWTKYLILVSVQVAIDHARPLIAAGRCDLNAQMLDELERALADELGTSSARRTTSDVSQNFVSYVRKLLQRIDISDKAMATVLEADQRQSQLDPAEVLRDLSPQIIEGAKLIGAAGLQLTITLDKFDDYVDRLVSNDVSKTRQLRRHFLHGLISSLYHLQKRSEFNWLMVVASLPDDLVIDLDLREIASYKNTLLVEIRWTPEDLKTMLNNRIASVLPGANWNDLFQFQVNNLNPRVQKKEGVSDYIIRHTTRRPRELMAHALRIFEAIRRTSRPVGSDRFGLIVKGSNPEIVKTQIIPEWRTVLPNFENAVAVVARTEQVTIFPWSDVIKGTAFSQFVDRLRGPAERHLPADARALLTLSSLFRVGGRGVQSQSEGAARWLHPPRPERLCVLRVHLQWRS